MSAISCAARNFSPHEFRTNTSHSDFSPKKAGKVDGNFRKREQNLPTNVAIVIFTCQVSTSWGDVANVTSIETERKWSVQK